MRIGTRPRSRVRLSRQRTRGSQSRRGRQNGDSMLRVPSASGDSHSRATTPETRDDNKKAESVWTTPSTYNLASRFWPRQSSQYKAPDNIYEMPADVPMTAAETLMGGREQPEQPASTISVSYQRSQFPYSPDTYHAWVSIPKLLWETAYEDEAKCRHRCNYLASGIWLLDIYLSKDQARWPQCIGTWLWYIYLF